MSVFPTSFFSPTRWDLTGFAFPGEVLTSPVAGQWAVEGVPVIGETGTTYTVGVRDIGKRIRCGASTAARVWHPNDIPQVKAVRLAWAQAYHGVGPDVLATEGQTVTAWDDLKNGWRASRSVANLMPTYKENGAGTGLPSLYFDITTRQAGLHINSGPELGLYRRARCAGIVVGYRNPLAATQDGYHEVYNARGGAGANRILMLVAWPAAGWVPGPGWVPRPNDTAPQGGVALQTYGTQPTPENFTVACGNYDTFEGVARMWAGTLANTASGMTTPIADTDSTIISIGNGAVLANARFGGDITGVINFADEDSPISALDLRRCRQYLGRCSGIDLGLSVL